MSKHWVLNLFALYVRQPVRIDLPWRNSSGDDRYARSGSKAFPVPTPLGALLLLYLLVAIFSSIYTVGKSEQAVVQTFGRYTETKPSGGPYLKLPAPFQTVTKVDVQTALEIPIGFRVTGEGEQAVLSEAQMLTGDLNIVNVDSVVQFHPINAKQWLFSVDNPVKALNLFAQASLRRGVAATNVDDVLTTGRQEVQGSSETKIRELVETVGLGVRVIAHQIQDAHPPQQVQGAYQDVTNANEDRQKMIEEGRGYQNKWIAAANGEAKKVIEEAEGYKAKRINDAKGAADRFNLLYAEYAKSPVITRQRMQLEALNTVLPGKTQIIDMSAGHAPLKFLDVGALTAAQRSAQPK